MNLAVKNENIEIVKLLLNCKKIDVNKPVISIFLILSNLSLFVSHMKFQIIFFLLDFKFNNLTKFNSKIR